MSQEQEFWTIRAKTEWLQQRDRNTKFFHATVLSNRGSLKISALKDDSGNWIQNNLQILGLFGNHFKTVYHCSDPFPFAPLLDLSDYSLLLDSEYSFLANPITFEEVTKAIFEMGPYKAPRPDGFHPIFFQKSWDILGPKVFELVKQIFSTGQLPLDLNKTVICLIPKKVGPTVVSHFRPIGLCNTIYKIVTRILVNRLRPIIQQVITPNKTRFVSGRRASDNHLFGK